MVELEERNSIVLIVPNSSNSVITSSNNIFFKLLYGMRKVSMSIFQNLVFHGIKSERIHQHLILWVIRARAPNWIVQSDAASQSGIFPTNWRPLATDKCDSRHLLWVMPINRQICRFSELPKANRSLWAYISLVQSVLTTNHFYSSYEPVCQFPCSSPHSGRGCPTICSFCSTVR